MSPNPSVDQGDGYHSSRTACSAVRPHLLDLLDGRLNAERSRRLKGHLQICTPCRQEWEAVRASERALCSARRSLPSPGDLRTDFHARLAARSAVRRQARPWLLRLAAPALATTLLIMVWGRGSRVIPSPGPREVAVPPEKSEAIPESAPLLFPLKVARGEEQKSRTSPLIASGRDDIRDATPGRRKVRLQIASAAIISGEPGRNSPGSSALNGNPKYEAALSSASRADLSNQVTAFAKTDQKAKERPSQVDVTLSGGVRSTGPAPVRELIVDAVQSVSPPIREIVDVHVIDARRHFDASLKVVGNHCSVTDSSANTPFDVSEDAAAHSTSGEQTEGGDDHAAAGSQ